MVDEFSVVGVNIIYNNLERLYDTKIEYQVGNFRSWWLMNLVVDEFGIDGVNIFCNDFGRLFGTINEYQVGNLGSWWLMNLILMMSICFITILVVCTAQKLNINLVTLGKLENGRIIKYIAVLSKEWLYYQSNV